MGLLTGLERVALDSIEVHPANPRRGDVAAIAQSLTRNGQFAPVVVQACSRFVLAGNHTVLAARSLGWTEIDAVLVDVDEPAAYRIMLAANRTQELGGYDTDALAELLSYLDDDLIGSGYTERDIQALIAPPPEWDDEHAITAVTDPSGALPDAEDDEVDGASADGRPAGREYDPATSGGDYMQLAWLVPAADCDTVRAALGAARTTYGLDTAGEALVAIARDWLANNR
jgi:hypothetical protein